VFIWDFSHLLLTLPEPSDSCLPGLIIGEISPLIVQEPDVEYIVGMPYNRGGSHTDISIVGKAVCVIISNKED